MANQTVISPETILRMAQEVLGTPITEKESQLLATLLSNLRIETIAMHSLDVADAEPVTLYEARP